MNLAHKYLAQLKEQQELIKKAPAALSEWEIERIQDCLDGLMTFSKFKEGDLVRMAETYPVSMEESWGWMGCKHLLTKNQRAMVDSVEWYKGSFRYTVVFEQRSYWSSEKKKAIPCNDATRLTLGEKWLKLANEEQQ